MECPPEAIDSARKSVEDCETNVDYCGKNIEIKKNREAQIEATERSNFATKRFNEGTNFIKKINYNRTLEEKI